MCKVEKSRHIPKSDSRGVARRGAQRVRILAVLQGLCVKIEQLQQTDDARLACREVAHLIGRLKLREGGRGSSKKSNHGAHTGD